MQLDLLVARTHGGDPQRLTLSVTDRLVLGRDPASPVQFEGGNISREHLAFICRGSTLLVEDLSSNGTWLNDERLRKDEPRALESGDLIEVPGYRLEVSVSDTEQQAASSAQPAVGAVSAPEAKKSPLIAVLQFASSFGSLEICLILISVCSFSLIYLYLSS